MTTVLEPYTQARPEPPEPGIRCVVVDDHPAVRLGLSTLLSAEPDIDVLDAFASAETALAFTQAATVDVVVVDYQLPGHSGLWLCRKLKRLAAAPAVLIYSAFSDHLLAAASVVAQADGLVSKAALGAELCERIRAAAHGVTVPPSLPTAVAASVQHRFDHREQAIYALLVAGVGREQIGRTLGIEHGELETQLWVMLKKLERRPDGRL